MKPSSFIKTKLTETQEKHALFSRQVPTVEEANFPIPTPTAYVIVIVIVPPLSLHQYQIVGLNYDNGVFPIII
jgi:hypothetical protein